MAKVSPATALVLLSGGTGWAGSHAGLAALTRVSPVAIDINLSTTNRGRISATAEIIQGDCPEFGVADA